MQEFAEPAVKRAVAFFDGQNLFRHAKEAFGHYHPNYDPNKLFAALWAQENWQNAGVRFYTGTPSAAKDPRGHGYWAKRTLAMRRAGIFVETRELRYRQTKVPMVDGSFKTIDTPQEKGIDIRIALDIIRTTITNQLDVAVVFSQDQDLAEIPKDLQEIATAQKRWIKMVSAFPIGANASSKRGIGGCRWIGIDQTLYEACLDPRDYRPTFRI